MERESKAMMISLLVSICLLLVAVTNGFGEEYEVLKGLKSVNAVFDVRAGNPKGAALTLKVIHQTYQDKNITAITKNPSFTVVFIGPSVKLISKSREGFSSEEQKVLDEIASTISQMSKEGIKFEICLIAAQVLGVDPASVLPEIKHVGNGFISLIGYQAKGYALVPAY
jgi:intracellular sulfur oxidation DsrE/DsrF family protein